MSRLWKAVVKFVSEIHPKLKVAGGAGALAALVQRVSVPALLKPQGIHLTGLEQSVLTLLVALVAGWKTKNPVVAAVIADVEKAVEAPEPAPVVAPEAPAPEVKP